MPRNRSTAKFCPTCKQTLASNYSLDVSREACEFLSDVTPAMLIFTASAGSLASGMLTDHFGDYAPWVFLFIYLFAAFTLSSAAVSSFAKCHRKMRGPGWRRPVQRLFLLLSCGLLSVAMFVATLPAWRMLSQSRQPQSASGESIALQKPPVHAAPK